MEIQKTKIEVRRKAYKLKHTSFYKKLLQIKAKLNPSPVPFKGAFCIYYL